MLNGFDPLLVITLKNKGLMDFFAEDSILDSIAEAVGVPIPIYLSEKLTGIYVDTENRSIDVETRVEPTTEKDTITQEVEAPKVTQTAVDTQLTINLLASKNSILLTALIALMEQLVKRLVSGEYSIHYINGPTVIFGGLLHRFATSVNGNEDLVRVELTLSTAAKENPTPKTPVETVSKVTGAVPL